VQYCLNCGAEVQQNYCPNCGQKVTVKRLSAKSLLEELFYFFTHIEHTFLKTLFEFIVRPGVASLNYLKGKRKHYQKPVSFFLIWTGLYILFHNIIISYFHYLPDRVNPALAVIKEESNELLRSNFTFFFLPVLFVSAVSIYFFLAKPRFNFVEIITLCLYGAGCFNALLFLGDVLLGFVFRTNINANPVFIYQTTIAGTYNLWFCFDFFKKLQLRYFWPRLLLNALFVSLFGWMVFIYFPYWWLLLTK